MRVGQRPRNLGGNSPGMLLGQRSACNVCLERFSVEELEDEERSVVPYPPVVSSHDVRVVQAGRGPRLSIEELQVGVVEAPAPLEQLDRHRA